MITSVLLHKNFTTETDKFTKVNSKDEKKNREKFSSINKENLYIFREEILLVHFDKIAVIAVRFLYSESWISFFYCT